MCLWKVLEQWKCQKTTRVYPQRRFCSKASTANKSQSLSEGAALEAQVDSCLHAHSFLVKAANFASLHKGPQIQYLLVFFFLIQLCSWAMQSSRKSQYTYQIKCAKPKPKSKPVSFYRVQDMYGIFLFLPLQTIHTASYLTVDHWVCWGGSCSLPACRTATQGTPQPLLKPSVSSLTTITEVNHLAWIC